MSDSDRETIMSDDDRIPHTIDCPECDGWGHGDPADPDSPDECENCGGLGYVHHDPRLKGRTTCAVCGHRYSWGCGHSDEQESAFLDHCDTTAHLLGDCDCYESRPGYAARFTRDERRERVAAVLRALDAAVRAGDTDAARFDDLLWK